MTARASRLVDFYFRIDLRSLGAFRIAVGLLLLANWCVQWAWLDTLYTDQGVLPCDMLREANGRMSPFFLTPLVWIDHWPWAMRAFFLFALVCYLALLLGWRTRLFTVLSLVCWGAILNRNPYTVIGADRVLATMLLWSVFLPLGARFSLDALRQGLAQGIDPQQPHPVGEPLHRAPRQSPRQLAAFGIVLQIGLIYLLTAIWKSGWTWDYGLATYLVVQIDQFIYPAAIHLRELPLFWHKVLTYGTLAVEYAALPMILCPWFQPHLRRLLIVGLLALHGGIWLTIDEGFFSQTMVATYTLLLTPRDWELLARLLRRFSRPATAYYDDTCGICQRTAEVITLLDRFGMIRWIGTTAPRRFQHDVPRELIDKTVVVYDARGRMHTRSGAFVQLARALPLPWHAAWVLRLPGLRQLADWSYDLVARHRHRISAWLGLAVCGVPPAGRKPKPRPTGEQQEGKQAAAPQAASSWRRWGREALTAVLFGSILLSCYEENVVPGLAGHGFGGFPFWGRSIPNPVLHLFQAQQIWYMFAPDVPLSDTWWVAPARVKGEPQPIDLLTGQVVDESPPPWWEHRYPRIWGTYLFYAVGHGPVPPGHPEEFTRRAFCRFLVRRYEAEHPGKQVEKLEVYILLRSTADAFLGRPVRQGRLLLATWEPATQRFALGPEHGWIKMFNSHGEVIAEGPAVMTNYLNDGHWTIQLPDGSVEEGQYRNGNREGLWRKTFADGSWAEGEFRRGQREGQWNFYYPDGRLKAQGRFVNDAREGVWTQWYPSGRRSKQFTYRRGEKHGPFMAWHPNGLPQQKGHYQHDRLHGPWQSWYRNGQLQAQGQYRHGKRHGVWRFWDSQGESTVEVEYQEGKELRKTLLTAQPDMAPER